MPTDIPGVLQLSKHLLHNRKLVGERLMQRPCHLHNRSDAASFAVTVNDWLDGLLVGKDLMSDHDSMLSKSNFSHLLWKSMGHWRMKPGSSKVYLECRHTKRCLPDIVPPKLFEGPRGLIQMVAHKMKSIEVEQKYVR